MKEPRDLALEICDFLYEKKGENVQVLDVAHLTSITEYFVIASARNTIQCRSLAEDLEEHILESDQMEPRRKEGYRDSRWVVLDYSSVIVHIFHEQEREFYNLERLWSDGENLIRQM